MTIGDRAAASASSSTGAYEEFSYPGFAYAATHPSRLQVLGELFGLAPAPAASCRVLELGCGDGGNILAMAQALPGAHFLGIDLAAGAIARGVQLIEQAGLENVQLLCADLEQLPRDIGSFDYIVAHGVYSWVPPGARAALLACCRRHLNPTGIAFVSYNAYPGSHLRDMARDVLRHHVRNIEGPQQRLAAAHELMQTLVAIEEPTPYARVLREQMQRMLRFSDALLLHDDLAEISTPFYFHEFMAQAEAHGLAFLSEADLFESQLREVPQSAEDLVGALTADPRRAVLEREQYLDFFKNRMFRQTLLCHSEAPVVRELDDRRLEQLHISSSVQPGQADQQGLEFVTLDGFSVSTSEPLVLAAMRALAEAWPATLSFYELLESALEASPEASAQAGAARLREVLLQAYLARVVQLHGAAPAVSSRPGKRPLAGALTRAQAKQGSPVVSSMLHTNVRLESDLEVGVLTLLDGTRGLDALATALSQPTAAVQSVLERFASVGLLRKS